MGASYSKGEIHFTMYNLDKNESISKTFKVSNIPLLPVMDQDDLDYYCCCHIGNIPKNWDKEDTIVDIIDLERCNIGVSSFWFSDCKDIEVKFVKGKDSRIETVNVKHRGSCEWNFLKLTA